MEAIQTECAQAAPEDVRSAIAAAYATRADELRAYVVRQFGGNVVAEDVVHEAFERLAREAMAARMPAQVRPWLYQVAHNLAVSELRRRDRRDVQIASIDRAPRRAAPSAETEWVESELSWELREALGSLPPAGRVSIILASDGYSGREIADAVGRTELATRALLCRTRRSLRRALATIDLGGKRAAATWDLTGSAATS